MQARADRPKYWTNFPKIQIQNMESPPPPSPGLFSFFVLVFYAHSVINIIYKAERRKRNSIKQNGILAFEDAEFEW